MNYDISYYEKSLRDNSFFAYKINEIRWNFIAVQKFLEFKILDFGSGVGWFRAYRPKGVEVDTYDIMAVPQTGIQQKEYDMVCFWDVLEHIDWNDDKMAKIPETVINSAEYVAVSVPIKPRFMRVKKWKHYKPGEHLTRFTIRSLDKFFKKRGFHKIKDGTQEVDCDIREDIYSAIYKRGDKIEKSAD